MLTRHAEDKLKEAIFFQLGHSDDFGCQGQSEAEDRGLGCWVDVPTADVHGYRSILSSRTIAFMTVCSFIK